MPLLSSRTVKEEKCFCRHCQCSSMNFKHSLQSSLHLLNPLMMSNNLRFVAWIIILENNKKKNQDQAQSREKKKSVYSECTSCLYHIDNFRLTLNMLNSPREHTMSVLLLIIW